MSDKHTKTTPQIAHTVTHFGRLNARGGSFFGIYPPTHHVLIVS